jgi:hypothetical protein
MLLLETHHGSHYHSLSTRMQTLVTQYAKPHWQALSTCDPGAPPPLIPLQEASTLAEVQAHMEALGQEMTQLLLSTRDTLLQHGPTKVQQPSGHHYRPRKVNQQRHRLAKLRKTYHNNTKKGLHGPYPSP